MTHRPFRAGWDRDWSCDPVAARAWHVTGVTASVRGKSAGLPVVRLDGLQQLDRRTWDVEALRAEAFLLAWFEFEADTSSLRFSVDLAELRRIADLAAGRRERRYWLTDIEAQQVERLLERLRGHLP